MDRKPYDFSCKHDIWILDETGDLRRMDEPFFRAELLAPGTWLIRSDGDFSYLVEGERESLLIDSGYGCGDIRAFCQTLTDRPVRHIANTHPHFDHTANNGRFDLVYLTRRCHELATRPFPSFEGILFPGDYPVQYVTDGDVIDLGGRTLEVAEIADHAPGGAVYLDRKERILFSGDEFMPRGKVLNDSVANWEACTAKVLRWRDAYDVLCGGTGPVDPRVAELEHEICRRILNGDLGQPAPPPENSALTAPEDPEGLGRTVFARYRPRPTDLHPAPVIPNLRVLEREGHPVTFDGDHIR